MTKAKALLEVQDKYNLFGNIPKWFFDVYSRDHPIGKQLNLFYYLFGNYGILLLLLDT